MPGLNVSPSHRRFIVQHDTASDYLAFAYPTLHRHEASANIVLAHALKRVSAEAALSGYQFISDSDVKAYLSSIDPSALVPHRAQDSFWLTMWSFAPAGPVLELVLSRVSWTLGEYPIFLWTPNHPSTLSSEWLAPRITQLTEHLQNCVPPERIFSVFGMTPLVKAFARRWSDMTGFAIEPEPFYAAYFSYCTPQTFQDSDSQLPEGHQLRRASLRDLDSVAQLCKEFADDSVYFPLAIERARIEARELITKGQIWVYDANGVITTICAVTRNSQRVSAITKVYTTPAWRRRRCAEFLVRDVTARLLFDCGKDCVVLYVGHDNSAQRVYDRVGFAGLCGKDKPAGVEDSLELGFAGTQRGHW
ncbi:hypothetical protein WOLCODRAFT_135568 [Wolfiporia cocos MD-104 SS10]|uniref:N-acetyltransferase domain-containing protein n=1 Tax=Wolfiporia cocos (strain MD-104) TaxID=742152 RepID=A0A2H3IW65_WOLCO|nr:hypothetical protein WOLCODRAFT_135568 [Wolfiporia cocos MD-104 SS10]